MEKTSLKVLMVGCSAVAGGAVGAWAGVKLGATYGLRAGPWGVIAGALVGAYAGAKLTGMLHQGVTTAEPGPVNT
mgnify:CR=1 FL=1